MHVAAILALLAAAAPARAQEPTGAPPPEATKLVEAPKTAAEEPKNEKPTEGTTITLSAGGQLATGNSRLLASTINGAWESRFGDNGVGFSLVGNYGESALPNQDWRTTTENVQGRGRYDRYVTDDASVFIIATGRHDRFQGLDLRLNLDPGFKYLFMKEQANALWAEAGYDFQYDIRRDDARVQVDDSGNPIAGAPLLDKTATDHSGRLFAGYRHAFNKEVTLSTGVEYLQSVVESTRYRVNFDALFAANVGGGLAVGLGFLARYDHAPLPGKADLDTATTLSLIYSYSDAPEKK